MVLIDPSFPYRNSTCSCKNCSIRYSCLASNLEDRQLDRFESKRGAVRILRTGQHLFRAGDKFIALYIVRSGMVKASVITDDGGEQITGFYLPGEILGLDSIEEGFYLTTAVALETCSICNLPFDKIIALSAELPTLQKQLWRQSSRVIADNQELHLAMGRKDAEVRIAGFLLSLSLRFKRIGYSPTSFHLPMGRNEIGNYLGMTLETVCRVLSRFEKAGFICKEKRNINHINVRELGRVYFGKSFEQQPERKSGGTEGKSQSLHPCCPADTATNIQQ